MKPPCLLLPATRVSPQQDSCSALAAEGPCPDSTSGLLRPCISGERRTPSLPISVIFPRGFHFLLSGGCNSALSGHEYSRDRPESGGEATIPARKPPGSSWTRPPRPGVLLLERLCTWAATKRQLSEKPVGQATDSLLYCQLEMTRLGRAGFSARSYPIFRLLPLASASVRWRWRDRAGGRGRGWEGAGKHVFCI